MVEEKNQSEPGIQGVFRKMIPTRARVFALLDAARCPDGPERAAEANVHCESLLAGDIGRELSDVAPYLVEFRANSSFGAWWFGQWGRSLGVLVETPVRPEEIRRHFRTVLVVRHEDGQKYFFRFYDPRVLRVFLPNCTADEVRRFFGPVVAFHCESEDGKGIVTFKPGRDGVSVTEGPVTTSSTSIKS